MTLILAAAVGILCAVALYHLMGDDVFQIALGAAMLLNGLNLIVIASAGDVAGHAPFTQLHGERVDALVQAMVLTAIVIGLGVLALLLLVGSRLSGDADTQDIRRFRRWRH